MAETEEGDGDTGPTYNLDAEAEVDDSGDSDAEVDTPLVATGAQGRKKKEAKIAKGEKRARDEEEAFALEASEVASGKRKPKKQRGPSRTSAGTLPDSHPRVQAARAATEAAKAAKKKKSIKKEKDKKSKKEKRKGKQENSGDVDPIAAHAARQRSERAAAIEQKKEKKVKKTSVTDSAANESGDLAENRKARVKSASSGLGKKKRKAIKAIA